MKNNLESSIRISAADIADTITGGGCGARRRAINDFIEIALWAAVTAAESISTSAWVDPTKDDKWTKTAADRPTERFELPDTMTDKQFRELAELLHLGKDSLEKSIPTRIKMQPELMDEVNRILGKPSTAPLPSVVEPKTEDLIPEKAPMAPAIAPEKEPEAVEKEPAKRELGLHRDDVHTPVDEFDSDIIDKPGLPGDPRLGK